MHKKFKPGKYSAHFRFDTIFYMASLDACPETILDQVFSVSLHTFAVKKN